MLQSSQLVSFVLGPVATRHCRSRWQSKADSPCSECKGEKELKVLQSSSRSCFNDPQAFTRPHLVKIPLEDCQAEDRDFTMGPSGMH